MRIAIVHGIPAPYREPVFAELARRPGVELCVYYCSRGHDDVGWAGMELPDAAYQRVFPPNLSPRALRRRTMIGYVHHRIRAELERFRPETVVVYGTNQATYWLTFGWCMRRGVPFYLRSDSNARLDHSTRIASRVRRRMLRWLVPRCAGFLCVGSANRDYWRGHGAREDQLFHVPYAVDNERIGAIADSVRVPFSGSTRLLYVGRLVPAKGLDTFLAAFDAWARQADVRLTIVGDGPERERLQALQGPQARDRTRWVGRLPNDRVSRCYGDADVLVLPSRREPWGLVVNEAMAAGLPVLAGADVGAAIDLVQDGRTGWRVDAPVIADWIRGLERCLADRDRHAAMGRAARELVRRDWSQEREVDGFLEAFASRRARLDRRPAALVR